MRRPRLRRSCCHRQRYHACRQNMLQPDLAGFHQLHTRFCFRSQCPAENDTYLPLSSRFILHSDARPDCIISRYHMTSQEREDGIHGTSGVDVSTIEFVPLNPDKHMNPILLRKLVIQQKERLTALIEVKLLCSFMHACSNQHTCKYTLTHSLPLRRYFTKKIQTSMTCGSRQS